MNTFATTATTNNAQLKFGIDCHVPKSVIEALINAGHEVVVVAQDSEADADWFARGRAAGMTHVYSGDEDLFDLCQGTEVKHIWARPGQALRNQLRIIRESI